MPSRYLTDDDRLSPHPVHAVWELTLACDLKCHHCGSRAATRRPKELTTEECLSVVRQLKALGCREITLIGGEAYLRQDWLTIVRAIRDEGMKPTMQTGGRNLNQRRVREAAEAGLVACGVSIDGLEALHDELRGVKGSFRAAVEALRLLRENGIDISVNSQISSRVMPQLREMKDLFVSLGVKNWQIQLTVAMGRAADNAELLLQPHQITELMPLLHALYLEADEQGLLIQPGNNIGYFGPFESVWRGSGRDGVHWIGCNAGQNTLGIEADGTIKGCPSLPTTAYGGGNIRDLSLERIWNTAPELAFTRKRTSDDLWGFCKGCYYADVCRAGCSWTTHTLLGRPGNNPYCHYRALALERQGLRERIAKVEQAPGKPFDYGKFELVVEKLRADGSSEQVDAEQAYRTAAQAVAPARASLPSKQLELCRSCKSFIYADETQCPHCQADVAAAEAAYQERLSEALEATLELEMLLNPALAAEIPPE